MVYPTASGRSHSVVEKEAYAVVEATRKWRHHLRRHFKLITNYCWFVSIYGTNKRIGKIERWEFELAGRNHDVVYRPGADSGLSMPFLVTHVPTLLARRASRASKHIIRSQNLKILRMLTQNKSVTFRCYLFKATFELLSISFKGSVPSNTRNCLLGARWTKWLEREFTDRKARGSNPISASRLPLSRLGQPGSIPALVPLSCGMAARHRKGATAERFNSHHIASQSPCAHISFSTTIIIDSMTSVLNTDASPSYNYDLLEETKRLDLTVLDPLENHQSRSPLNLLATHGVVILLDAVHCT
ncbi:hypothetical protein T265_02601 [Opisthorchis viverrini]|uniref:Reverse transcriptase RNase H-like domain-containing protein n=1 Tax=Opisthorchis viverrini TaxID=6198 RepID=A0A074ZV66_OPIVI|nr:hypothetical protein T265_02601 [Opisthorchis viverrini]KER31036.1 hypothetical protein T265_02601 [Opisthorchis viverrini]